MIIPFNKIHYTGNEKEYIEDALKNECISGDQKYTEIVQSFLRDKVCANNILMTTSATHALEISALLIELNEGDEVIMPSYTFPSTANAVMLRGAKPVFAEVREDTLNIDPADIESKITNRTKAIIPVHYAGISCDMDLIMKLSRQYNLYVIEDAAQGVNAMYKNRYLGTIGDFGCYSFHSTKNYVSGEGGAILINLCERKIIDRSEVVRQKGTNRKNFLRGEVDKYSWTDIGSSYTPSDILMALLYAQLEDMENITQKRKYLFEYYSKALTKYVNLGKIKYISSIPNYCKSNYYIFYIIFEDEIVRDRVIHKLKEKGISAYTHFVPLHQSHMGRKLGYNEGDFKITESAAKGIVRLPLYTDMTESEIEYVISNLESILKEI